MRRVFLTSLTVVSAVALYLTSGSYLALGAAAILAVLGMIGERLEIPVRVVAVLALVSIVAPFLFQVPIPRANGFLFEPGLSFTAGLFACFGSAVLLLRKNRGYEEQILLATSTIIILVAGNTTTVFPFGFAVLAYTALLVLYLRSQKFGFSSSTVISTGVALIFALLLAMGMSWTESGFQSFFSSMQSWSASVNFGEVAGIKPQSGPGGTKVLLRFFSDNPQNYMAARRYVKYESQKWRGSEPRPAEAVDFQDARGYWLRGVPAEDWRSEGADRVEVATLNPEALLAPLSTRMVKVSLDKAEVSWCGDLLVKDTGVSFDGSYEVVMGAIPIEEEPEYLERCLQVEVAPEVAELARVTAGDGPDEYKVFNLVKFFQENFEYGFGYPFDKAEDPVAKFLEERPPAHCEVFATSLALMCRSVGVPARYVQGFLVREKNEWGDYWVSRERDAHAWVEVYIEGTGWVQVDATPPGVSAPMESESSWGEFTDTLKRMFQRVWAFFARGPSALWNDVSALLGRHPVAFSLALILAVAWRLRRKFSLKRNRSESEDEAPEHPSIQELKSFLETFEAVVGEQRPAGYTVLEWARLRPDEEAFLRAYSEARYSRRIPCDEALVDLRSALERIKAAYAKKG